MIYNTDRDIKLIKRRKEITLINIGIINYESLLNVEIEKSKKYQRLAVEMELLRVERSEYQNKYHERFFPGLILDCSNFLIKNFNKNIQNRSFLCDFYLGCEDRNMVL